MSANGQAIINLINKWVREDGVAAFHNLRLNSILLQMVNLFDTGGGGGGGGGTGIQALPLTSADFINATDCPLTALDGLNLLIYYVEDNNFIYEADSQWTPLAGGGFRITIPEWDSTFALYRFVVFVVN